MSTNNVNPHKPGRPAARQCLAAVCKQKGLLTLGDIFAKYSHDYI